MSEHDDGEDFSDADIIFVMMGLAIDACERVIDQMVSVLAPATVASMRGQLEDLRHLRTQVLAEEVELRGEPQRLLGFMLDAHEVADLLTDQEVNACKECKANIDWLIQQA